MTSEVGSGQVAIFPTFKGFRKNVADEVEGSAKTAATGFSRVLSKAGASVGRTSGRGFKGAFASASAGAADQSVKQITAAVAVASRALSAARLKEQDAAGKVRVAEAQLTEARAKGAAGSARVIAAEERLASAQRATAAAQGVTATSTNTLRDAQARLAAATESGNVRQTRSFKTLFTSVASGAGSVRVFSRFGKNAGVIFGESFRGAIAPLIGTALALLSVRKLTEEIKDSIKAVGNWASINAQTKAAVLSTGHAAGVTRKYVHDLSQSLEEQTSTEAESIQKGANLLLTFRNIRDEVGKGNNIFTQSVGTLVDMARAMGKAPRDAAIQLGKALNDPVVGITALTRVGVTFTKQQKDQIAALVKSGNTLAAQKIILAELNAEFGGSGAAFMRTYEGRLYALDDAAHDVGETIGGGLTPSIKHFARIAADYLRQLDDSAFLKSFVGKVNSAATTVTDKGAQIVTLIQQLASSDQGVTFAGLSTGLGDILPKLKPFLAILDAVQPVVPALAAALGDIAPKLAPVLPSLSTLVVTLLPSLADIIQAILPAIPPLAQALAALAPIITVVAQVLAFLIKSQYGALDGLEAIAKGASKASVVADALGGKFGFLVQVAAKVGSALGQVISFIRTLTGESFKVVGILANLPKAGTSFVDGLAGAISNGLGPIDALKKGVEGIFAGSGKTASGGKVVKQVFDEVDDSARKARAGLAAATGQKYTISLDGSAAIHNALVVAKAAYLAATAARAAADPSDRGVYGRAVEDINAQITALGGLASWKAAAATRQANLTAATNTGTGATKASTKATEKATAAQKAYAATLKKLTDQDFLTNGVLATTMTAKQVQATYLAMIAKIKKARADGKITKAEFTSLVGDAKDWKKAAGDAANAVKSVFSNATSWLTPSTLSSGAQSTIDAVLDAFNAGSFGKKTSKAAKATLKTLTSSITSADKQMQVIADQRAALADKISDANQKLSDAISLRDDYKKTIADAVSSLGNIATAVTSSEQAVTQRIGDVLYTSTQTVSTGAAGIISNLQSQIAKAQAFQKTLASLKALGLDDTSYKQLVDQFAQNGDTTNADALLAGGSAAVQQVATLQGQLTQAGNDLGVATSSALYQAGVDAAQGLYDGLVSQDSQLAAAAQHVADVLVAQIKATLGIASPSKVLKGLGVYGGTGLALGFDATANKVKASVAALAAIPAGMSIDDPFAQFNDQGGLQPGKTFAMQVVNHNPVAESDSELTNKARKLAGAVAGFG